MGDIDDLETINKNIAELKKKILLCEGQKKANVEEWEKQKRQNYEMISCLKTNIKDLTGKLMVIKNPKCRQLLKQTHEVIVKVEYPVGAKNSKDALEIVDLKLTEVRKQMDLIVDRYKKRQKFFTELIESYHELLAYKNSLDNEVGVPPPETEEEDANRKLICHLENEIHRTNVQWMEAEHIRKKYRSIRASLMDDAEKFERSLRELEIALTEQQAEIDRLQQVHKDAIGMRDAAKIILQRQENQANMSTRMRDRQAIDFRKQVEERKVELERIERKLFSTGKTLVHQESIGSSSGDQQTGKIDHDDDPNHHLQVLNNEMEEVFKKLMEITGATTADDVLERFQSQQQSTTRLLYLRNSAEAEKKHLEDQREVLTAELEASKYAEIKEVEINQEQVEKIKADINELAEQIEENHQICHRIRKDIKSIKEDLTEMIFKLQEVDESEVFLPKKAIRILPDELGQFIKKDVDNEDLISVVEEKLKKALISIGELRVDGYGEFLEEPSIVEEPKFDELFVPIASPRTPSVIEEKPQPFPTCYINLLTGRAGQTSSTTPGQTAQPVPTDDESEVPSRNFLKRQAQQIVDSKSRRKGFRVPTQRRK